MSTTDFLFHCKACPAFLQVANHMVEDWAAAIALARLERWELRRGGWVCPVCADMGEECSCGGINTCEIVGKGRVKCRACGLEMSVTGRCDAGHPRRARRRNRDADLQGWA